MTLAVAPQGVPKCQISCIFTGRPAQGAAISILFLLSGPKIGYFAQQG